MRLRTDKNRLVTEIADGFYLTCLFPLHTKALYVALALNFPEGLPVAKAASIVNLLL
jgi:hypothetical protein